MTKEQILNATGDELSRLAGEVLPKLCFHSSGVYKMEYREGGIHWICPRLACVKMGVHPPIPLTWPEAMKWRDWAAGEYGLEQFYFLMRRIVPSTYDDIIWVIICLAKPEHYIKAACLCKLEKE